ncbi:MAG: GNAT family N-acetyltransferase, partial [Candidatus Bathyarchaeota archaeon]|nr:GNAT family N-acetyltransferase [Candidatus Bathyarchaeota archaeon]
ELHENFGKPNSLFLVARVEEIGRIVGVLGIRRGKWRGGDAGIMRGWEPAVLSEVRDRGVGEALIRKALDFLSDLELKKAVFILKYPYDSPETAFWHINLYRTCGFEQRGPRGVTLLATISRSCSLSASFPDFIKTVGWENYTLGELADFILRAYASTPEDREIHGWDPLVSNRDEIQNTLRSFSKGETGFRPECCKVALVDGKPAGFIGALIPKWKHRPPAGVLGPVGVFPEHRRRGIACFLIVEIHRVLRKFGCHYSLVGTPKTNQKAVRLYKRAGYRPFFEQIEFEKGLI